VAAGIVASSPVVAMALAVVAASSTSVWSVAAGIAASSPVVAVVVVAAVVVVFV
jgi:hypothetical protein